MVRLFSSTKPSEPSLRSGFAMLINTHQSTAKCVRNTYPIRLGLTLIELLVGLTIMGVLLAVLLPAVSAAREAARRMQCSNNLKQIGIGLHAYHNTHSTFPPGHIANLKSDSDGRSWGWGALLLPFVEQTALAEQLDTTRQSFDAVASSPGLAGLLKTNVSLYRCPSDPGDGMSHPYRSIFVTGSAALDSSTIPSAGLSVVGHIFRPSSGRNVVGGTQIAKSNYAWHPRVELYYVLDQKKNFLKKFSHRTFFARIKVKNDMNNDPNKKRIYIPSSEDPRQIAIL